MVTLATVKRQGQEVDVTVAAQPLQPGDIALRIPEYLVRRGGGCYEGWCAGGVQPSQHAFAWLSAPAPLPPFLLQIVTLDRVLEDNTLAELVTTGKLSGGWCM
jgi:hypothetical protein